MATRKRSRSETEESADDDDDSSTGSLSSSELAVANIRARKSAPIDKILNVVELCEQVLSHLPTYDLLHAMQVCRTFKTNIESSHQLQKNLYLTPDLPRPKLAISSSGTLLSGIRAEQHIAAAEAAGERETGEFTCCTPHPALQLDPDSHRVVVCFEKYRGLVDYAAHRFAPSSMYTTDSMIVRDSVRSLTENGSKPSGLENMLITQPPVTSVDLVLPCRRRRSCNPVNNTAGVTFGDVFKIVTDIATLNVAERAGELSSEDDPTRWVRQNGEYVLKGGGFEFV